MAQQFMTVVCVHARGRGFQNQAEARGESTSWGRTQVRNYEHDGEELVIMGDFNANPYHFEMCSRKGWYAVRDRVDLFDRRGRPKVTDPKRERPRPLYNPMWLNLPEPTAERPAFGTHHFNSTDNHFPWCHYDQILISHGLVESARPLEILTRLNGQRLVTESCRTIGDVYSDHLPVELEIRKHVQRS